MRRRTAHAIWLGAGYSKWSAGLPLASELFDFAIDPWPRESKRIEAVKARKAAWDATHPHFLAEQFIAHEQRSNEDARRDVAWYVARRLTDPFISEVGHGRRTYAVHDRMLELRGRFLNSLITSRCTGIVTTNYDLVVEYTLGPSRFNYGREGEELQGRAGVRPGAWRRQVRLTGRLPLAKIHGSVSWDETAHYVDARRGVSGEALIIAPAADKAMPPQLAPTWDLAHGILAEADRLIVFGFAFNEYDQDVLELMREAGKRLRRILLVDPYPAVERTAALWPDAEVRTAPWPPHLHSQTPEWIEARRWALWDRKRRSKRR